ncbi:Uncharacterized protein OBRU01_23868 [Operophtera brumata]|uniref:FLYWCH-type domain-containing protein n=1 Tax=Operophtera brumata TaxID=104452 RepID=A0A0L7KKN6_OPEBR|nr:Uncharacterized protein OBRU01_23868 [Operophtera brumata]
MILDEPIFSTTKNGKTVITYGGPRFNQLSYNKGPKAYYMCNKKASVFKTSRNGKPVIEYDNYRFNLYKVTGASGERRSWRCWRWRDGPCRASILTIADVIVKVGKTHNHPSLLGSKYKFLDKTSPQFMNSSFQSTVNPVSHPYIFSQDSSTSYQATTLSPY